MRLEDLRIGLEVRVDELIGVVPPPAAAPVPAEPVAAPDGVVGGLQDGVEHLLEAIDRLSAQISRLEVL